MLARFVARDDRRAPRVNALFRLDLRAFWLLSLTLGGILALLAAVMLAHALSS